MILGSAFLIILYLIFRYIIAWITYYNNLDPRLGESTWRFTYDYPVVGERDISDLDDKDFVRLRRKKNKIILLMYSIVLVMFVSSMSLLSKFLLLWKKMPKYKFLYKFFKLPIIFNIFSVVYEIVAFFLYLKNKKQLKKSNL